MTVLVTGGAGYIGSHTCVELLSAGFDVVVLDDLSNSKRESIDRIESISNKSVSFVEGDVRDRKCLQGLFKDFSVDAVIHFAGYKAVGESCEQPLNYFDNNVSGAVILAQEMEKAGVKKLVFSSSATVYGDPEALPITEDMPLSATNPYGRSKLIIEEMYRDLPESDRLAAQKGMLTEANPWSVVLLRYFNPVGAHKSGLIGEDPNDIPNNLMPYISQVAVGKLQQLSVFGSDYPTVDGTGVRDYIHVVDLARGHVKALEALLDQDNPLTGVEAFNLGTGNGLSVIQMVEAFEKGSGQKVPYKLVDRRPGDVAACYADASKAKDRLGWEAKLGVEEMTADTWRWQSQNPNGYE